TAIARPCDGHHAAAQLDLCDTSLVSWAAWGDLHLTGGERRSFMQRLEKPLPIGQAAVLRDAQDQIEPGRPAREQRIDVALPISHHGHGRGLAKPLCGCRTAGEPARRLLLLKRTVSAWRALALAPGPDRRVDKPDHCFALDVHGDHRVNEEAGRPAVPCRSKTPALLVSTREIDLAGVLHRQDAASPALRRRTRRAGRHNILGRHVWRRQKAVYRD